MEEFDDLFESSDSEVEEVVPVRRYIRDGENPLETLSEEQFKKRFRFTKQCVVDVLLPLIAEQFEKVNNRGLPIPAILQLLVALRFFGSNSFQLMHGDVRGLSQSTVSRIIKNVSICLAQYVHFPEQNNSFVNNTASFFAIANFPRVSGCINCAHIRIENPPQQNAEVFRNRKGWFSLNVQVVCGPQGEILDIIVRHPGSTHDSRIFNRSAVLTALAKLQLNQIQGLLLGDNGYACQPYLLTPVLNPVNRAEQHYNQSHCRTRSIVERLFGIWKRRFSCLKSGLRTELQTSIACICATAVLYNIGLHHNQNEIVDDKDEPHDQSNLIINYEAGGGLQFRREFINTYFN